MAKKNTPIYSAEAVEALRVRMRKEHAADLSLVRTQEYSKGWEEGRRDLTRALRDLLGIPDQLLTKL